MYTADDCLTFLPVVGLCRCIVLSFYVVLSPVLDSIDASCLVGESVISSRGFSLSSVRVMR